MRFEIYEDHLYPSHSQYPEEGVRKQWLIRCGQNSRTHIPNTVSSPDDEKAGKLYHIEL